MRVDPLQVLTKLAAAQNIPTRRVTPPFEGLDEFDYGLRRSLDPQFDWQEFGQLLLDNTPEQTLLFVEGTFELHFALFRIPDEENTVFLVGRGPSASGAKSPASGSSAIWAWQGRAPCRNTTTASRCWEPTIFTPPSGSLSG